MGLREYERKRDFTLTPEPSGKKRKGATRSSASKLSYVVQKHAATRLHYDFRLELDGVLLSWAVPKGPSLDPADKRLAVHVEDHPLEYGGFEGTIPQGQYGGGSVIVWDRGRWIPETDPVEGMKRGKLDFTLEGKKLGGSWHMVRLRNRNGEDGDNWLLMKRDDEFARRGKSIVETRPESVKTGRAIEEIGARSKVWNSNREESAKPARKAPVKAAAKTTATAARKKKPVARRTRTSTVTARRKRTPALQARVKKKAT